MTAGEHVDAWSALGAVDPATLVPSTLELHWAVQYVASAGQTFAEPRDDDSHRAMSWDADLRAFVGAPFAGPYPFRVALRPEDLTLLLLDRRSEALGTLPLSGQTRDHGYEWLSLGMATYMGGAPPLIERPEYDLPAHPVGDRAPFSERPTAELRTLASLYDASARLIGEAVADRPEASDVRCWPHHFDIASLLTVASGPDGSATRTVGVGMAPMGGGYPSWYLYVTPWPYPKSSALRPLAGPGVWHTEGWTGAVLVGDDVAHMPADARGSGVRAFLSDALDAALASLEG